MKIDEVAQVLKAKICTDVPYEGVEICVACGSDLMSDALAFGEDKGLLLTGLNNPQSIRTAEMMDIHCIVFVRNKIPTDAMLELAAERNMCLLSTKLTMFTACGLLFQQGIKGGEG